MHDSCKMIEKGEIDIMEKLGKGKKVCIITIMVAIVMTIAIALQVTNETVYAEEPLDVEPSDILFDSSSWSYIDHWVKHEGSTLDISLEEPEEDGYEAMWGSYINYNNPKPINQVKGLAQKIEVYRNNEYDYDEDYDYIDLKSKKIVYAQIDDDSIASVKISGGGVIVQPTGKVGKAKIYCTGDKGESCVVPVTVAKSLVTEYLRCCTFTKLESQEYSVIEEEDGSGVNSTEYIPRFNINYGEKKLKFHTIPNQKITLKLGGKKRNTKASSKGIVIVNVPICKIGTKFTLSLPYNGGVFKKSGKVKSISQISSVSRIYRKSKKVTIKVRNAHKGDVVKVKIGKKTISKKIGNSKKINKLTLKLPRKKKAGKTVKVYLYNKYKQKMGKEKKLKIYYASKIKKGMTKKQCRLVPDWESPDKEHVYGRTETWWYDYDDDGYANDAYLTFYKGKLIGWGYN